MANFLKSLDFKKVVAEKAFPYFEQGFNKCLEQFEEVGLVPANREDFSDLEKAAASLSDDEAINKKQDEQDPQ